MTVHMGGNLPSDEANGLAAMEGALVAGHLQARKHLVIGVVEVTGTKGLQKEGFKINPIVSLVQVEGVPNGHPLHDQILAALHKLFGERVGKVPMDFPGGGDQEEITIEVLEVTAGPDDDRLKYRAIIEDSAPGKIRFKIVTAQGAKVATRYNLPRAIYGELLPGEYQLAQLEAALRDLATSLVAEYEAGFSADEPSGEEEAAGSGSVPDFPEKDDEAAWNDAAPEPDEPEPERDLTVDEARDAGEYGPEFDDGTKA